MRRRLVLIVLVASILMPFSLGAPSWVHGQEATPRWNIDPHAECSQRAF
jgi:hypothetical protein